MHAQNSLQIRRERERERELNRRQGPGVDLHKIEASLSNTMTWNRATQRDYINFAQFQHAFSFRDVRRIFFE